MASMCGCNYYEIAPGERVPWGFHRHPDHEGLFYVIAGELAVEPCRFLAVGAPADDDGAFIRRECPACGA